MLIVTKGWVMKTDVMGQAVRIVFNLVIVDVSILLFT